MQALTGYFFAKPCRGKNAPVRALPTSPPSPLVGCSNPPTALFFRLGGFCWLYIPGPLPSSSQHPQHRQARGGGGTGGARARNDGSARRAAVAMEPQPPRAAGHRPPQGTSPPRVYSAAPKRYLTFAPQALRQSFCAPPSSGRVPQPLYLLMAQYLHTPFLCKPLSQLVHSSDTTERHRAIEEEPASSSLRPLGVTAPPGIPAAVSAPDSSCQGRSHLI